MIKKLILPFTLLLVLVGCVNNNEDEVIEKTITICEIDTVTNVDVAIDGNRTVTMEAVEDSVVRMIEINRLDLQYIAEALDTCTEQFIELWEANPDIMKEAFLDSMVASGSGITGELYDITDEYLILRVIMNFDEMSPDELEYLIGQRVSFVSLSEAIELAETLEGGICTQQ